MSEEISITIKLSSQQWGNYCPEARVSVNDNVVHDGIVNGPTAVTWQGTVNRGANRIVVELYNKQDEYTVEDGAGNIVDDVLLNINDINIDGIDLEYLVRELGVYYPVNPYAPEVVKQCVNLGWNGKWVLEFESPVYIWLLENF